MPGTDMWAWLQCMCMSHADMGYTCVPTRLRYAMSGTDISYAATRLPIALRLRYAMPAMLLRTCLPGTDLGYAATSSTQLSASEWDGCFAGEVRDAVLP
eukprot:1370220-Rhodomonas_salina.3